MVGRKIGWLFLVQIRVDDIGAKMRGSFLHRGCNNYSEVGRVDVFF
jgi:hypothetical protein